MLITEQARTQVWRPRSCSPAWARSSPCTRASLARPWEHHGARRRDASNPQMQAYLKRFKEVTDQESDRFASPIVYSSLQMLQQSIERVGKIDRRR